MPGYQDTSKPKIFSDAALYFTFNVRTSLQAAVPAETGISASRTATPIVLLVIPLSCLLLLPLSFHLFVGLHASWPVFIVLSVSSYSHSWPTPSA